MIKPGNAPRSLAGGLGGCTSPHGTSISLSSEEKNYSLPLRVTPDLVKSIKKRYPIESAVLDLMLLDGRAVLVPERSEG